ncbi:MAG: hypothetical protein IJL07_01745 [Lachnospiraceae bacterium]|nr:hypothetical protein [Lachnospiraceae bacterium]
MKNNQLLPFERNRYYAGKMLTSADFQAEQNYMNNKRRFVNNMMFGSGIVCGCNVLSLDDLSILVESGMAVDDYGREIVIASSVVKKLSAIDGFDSISGTKALLCLKYREDNVHTVYSVGFQDNKSSEYEYNRINESYDLFLMDAQNAAQDISLENELLARQSLYSDQDYRITLIIPSQIPQGKSAKVILRADKLSGRNVNLSYESVLQVPVFTAQGNRREFTLALDDISLKEGGFIEKEYWITAQDTPVEGAELVIKAGSTVLSIDGHEIAIPDVPSIKVSIIDIDTETLITREIAKASLELRTGLSTTDYIVLACLELVRTESAYIIDKISDGQGKKYIAAPSQHFERAKLSAFFSDKPVFDSKADLSAAPAPKEKEDRSLSNHLQVATGTLEIPLGDKPRRGDIRYSGEIMHGLGKGNVYVEIGYEQFGEDASLGMSSKSTVYGNAELFNIGSDKIPDVETAVKVLNDKGSFVVAAKLGKEPEFLTLTYRWVAIRFPSGNDLGLLESTSDKSITVETPTVILGTKDSYFFNVNFNNMDKCSVSYELTEEGSGEITAEGVYTAPAKEGVFEIRIFCVENPSICTYAYAIVKKKGTENA